MPQTIELSSQECEALLRSGVVGRVAVSTPSGPEILPMNYSVVDNSIVICTSSDGVVGRHGINAQVAFEVDQFDREYERGWSVVAHATSSIVEESAVLDRIRARRSPRPWAGVESRDLYVRLTWTKLTGRRLGRGWNLMAGLDTRQTLR